MAGVPKIHIIFYEKIFSIFRTEFERNLNQILEIIKIEIVNIECHTWGRSKKFSLFFLTAFFGMYQCLTRIPALAKFIYQQFLSHSRISSLNYLQQFINTHYPTLLTAPSTISTISNTSSP